MVKIELNTQQIRQVIKRLSTKDKIKIFRDLEKETWANRLDEVVTRIRKRARKNPISTQEINRICKETRQEIHNVRSKSHR